jgi:hypothetical protein
VQLCVTVSKCMELLLAAITAALFGQQTAEGIHKNARYMFVIDFDSSIVVMDTQKATMFRCTREFVCDGGLVLTQPKKQD